MSGRVSDLQVLEMLHLREAGETNAAIGKRFGMTVSAVAGVLHRVREGERAHEASCSRRGMPPCVCTKAENRNGGMPPRWWVEAKRVKA